MLMTDTPEWYVLHTYSGYENVAKENLENVVDKFNLKNRIFDIVIPTEEVVEERNGKKKLVVHKLYPGYIYINMIYGDDIWHHIIHTRGVTSFVGPNARAVPLSKEEVDRLGLEKEGTPVDKTDFAEGDEVEIIDGPLAKSVGKITVVDKEKEQISILMEMFGRETNVDLKFSQVRKINK